MTNISNQLKCSIFTVQLKTLFAKQEVQYGWKSEGQSERIRTFKSTIREWDRPKVDSCCPVCHSLPQRILEKKISENKYEMRREQICSFLFSITLYTPCFYYSPPIPVFSFICMCSLTRLAISASPLYIRLSTSVLCRSSPPWTLLLFASCALFWIKNLFSVDLPLWAIYVMNVS